MKNVKFDLNQKPKTTYDEVAYLVTKENVEYLHQYVKKYYKYTAILPYKYNTWSQWFHNAVKLPRQNADNDYYLYFGKQNMDVSYSWTKSIAEHFKYEIYNVIANKLLMKVE